MTVNRISCDLVSYGNFVVFIIANLTPPEPVPEGEAVFDKTTPEFDSTDAIFDDATRLPS